MMLEWREGDRGKRVKVKKEEMGEMERIRGEWLKMEGGVC